MITELYHYPCPLMKDGHHSPEMKWGGFSMAGGADYICELCGMSVMIFDETDDEVLERIQEKKNNENKI